MELASTMPKPDVDATVDPSPTAAEWAAFFAAWPGELSRLTALDVTDGHAAPLQPPTGTRASSRGWARYFDAHPALLAELAAQCEPEPERTRVIADGRTVHVF